MYQKIEENTGVISELPAIFMVAISGLWMS